MAKHNKNKQAPVNKSIEKVNANINTAAQDSIATKADNFQFWKNYFIPAAIFAAIIFILYGQSIKFEHVLDDTIVITDNRFVKNGFSGIGDIFSKESFAGYFGEQRNLVVGARYRPLSIASFAVETELFGKPSTDPKIAKYAPAAISHFNNILLYIISALILFRVMCLMIGEQKDKSWFFQLPFWITLLFVIHPLHTEVVANIKGRDEIMSLMGSLGALYFGLKYVDTQKGMHLLLMVVSFFLGLLAKENALTFLAIIPLSVWFFRSSSAQMKSNIWKVLGALAATALFYIIIRVKVIGYLLTPADATEIKDIMNNPFYGLSFVEKMSTVFYTLLLYLKLNVFPHPLTHDYYPYHIPIIKSFGDWRALVSIILHLGLVAIAVWQFKKRSMISYAILFYLITLSIVSNIPFSVGTFMNERFVYMSSLGFCIAFAYIFLTLIPSNPNLKWLKIGLLSALCIGFIGKSWSRIPAWKNTLSLNQAAIKVSKNSARANLFMGTALFQEYVKMPEGEAKNKLVPEFSKYVRRSIEINPNYVSGYQMYTGILAEEYKLDKDLDKLLKGFKETLTRVTPTQVPFILEYLEYLNKTSADKGKLGEFYYTIGYGLYLKEKNDLDLAKKFLNYGYEVDPNSPTMNVAMSELYSKLGDTQNESIFINRAKILDPSLK
ncbi:MAG: DUF1736 domain-containing protein [Saprospiraceae bacterium]|nr:DUF1736 domain-containing protein [Saprospiraceae bacterium]